MLNKHSSVMVKVLLMEREVRAHQLPEIRACLFDHQPVDVIRKNEDEDWSPSLPTINMRIVLEWMGTDLCHYYPSGKPFVNPKLPQVVARYKREFQVQYYPVDRGLIELDQNINPNNVFRSIPDAPIPTVKPGDLDNAPLEGPLAHVTDRFRCQKQDNRGLQDRMVHDKDIPTHGAYRQRLAIQHTLQTSRWQRL
ncbi:hypothetical protein AJ80_03484 [Polytolypa hystricis UAMH7299]|uniref:Uncharacterized protein n=1 Tax=Polytolypa hystricis (strain UAMH7299) TaxID=1447883 RepID=A0A2B7Y9I1_POLH7|nr:hypothetical protein AJ80_03484 [Polytolypa hystricis UAMH7299]